MQVQSGGNVASRGGRDKGKSIQIVALGVVLAVVIASVAYVGLDSLVDDEGSVYATWHYTAMDETDDAYYAGTLTITIEDGYIVDYDRDVKKIHKDDSGNPSIDLSPGQIGVYDPPDIPIPGPVVYPYEDSVQYHIKHTYPFMEGFFDSGYSTEFTNGDATVLAYMFENEEMDIYVSEDGTIFSIIEKTGETPMHFQLEGW